MSKPNPRIVYRSRDGKYDYSNMELVCVCGHTLGQHTIGKPRDCLSQYDTDVECSCKGFKPKKGQKKLVK